MACTGVMKFEGGVALAHKSDLVDFKDLLEVLSFNFGCSHPHHLGQSTHDPIIQPFTVTCLQGGHSAQLFQACVEGVLFDKVTFSAYMTDQKTKKHVLFAEIVMEKVAVENWQVGFTHAGGGSSLDESFTLVGLKTTVKMNKRGDNEKIASFASRANTIG